MSKSFKLKATATLLILIVLAVNEYKYRKTLSPVIKEVISYEGTLPGKLQTDVTPVFQRHLISEMIITM